MNLLFYGLHPERPLHLHMRDSDKPLPGDFVPPLSMNPLAVLPDGSRLKACLLDVRADWKFHKDRECCTLLTCFCGFAHVTRRL